MNRIHKDTNEWLKFFRQEGTKKDLQILSEGHGHSCLQEEQFYIRCGMQEEGNQKQEIPPGVYSKKTFYHDSRRNKEVIKQRSRSKGALEIESVDLSIIGCEDQRRSGKDNAS